MKISPHRSLARSPLPRSSQGPSPSGSLDRVTLSNYRCHPKAEVASHFAEAIREFGRLEPSHPTDQRAFSAGMGELRAVLSESLFERHWPEELPGVEGPVYRSPEKAGGLNRGEQTVGHHLVRIWAGAHQEVPRASLGRLATAIHHGQDVLQVRALRRMHPEYWSEIAGVLDKVGPAQDKAAAAQNAVAHYARAYQEFTQLVPTHPSEGGEFQSGFKAVGDVLRQELFDGRWPSASTVTPTEPDLADSAFRGGLTRSEQLVMHHLNLAAVHTLSGLEKSELEPRLGDALRQCQNILGSRVLRRRHPDYWMALPGSLAEEAAREKARWGA